MLVSCLLPICKLLIFVIRLVAALLLHNDFVDDVKIRGGMSGLH